MVYGVDSGIDDTQDELTLRKVRIPVRVRLCLVCDRLVLRVVEDIGLALHVLVHAPRDGR